MSVRINTNVDAFEAQRQLSLVSMDFSKAVQQLSSGLRINSAADDAAGLAISERLRAQVRGNNQAVRNSQDGISLFQTAEGSLDEVHSMLQRARELMVEAANGTLSNGDINSIGSELTQLGQSIDRIAHTTQFNGLIMLDGTFSGSVPGGATNPLTLQIGANGIRLWFEVEGRRWCRTEARFGDISSGRLSGLATLRQRNRLPVDERLPTHRQWNQLDTRNLLDRCWSQS